jgi:hypothetical protein
MKKLLPLFFIFCFSGMLVAQSPLRVEPTEVRKDVTASLLNAAYEEVSNVVIRNTSNRPVQIKWEEVVARQPAGWSISVCDEYGTYAPFSIANKTKRPISLGPGEATELYLHVQPNGRAGRAKVEVPLSVLTDPGKILHTAIFDISITGAEPAPTPNAATPAAATSAPRRPATRSRSPGIYPNPAVDHFYVQLPPGVELGRVDILNTLGRRVKSFEGRLDENGYKIDSLPEGIYLIGLYDSQGKVIKTLRLLHRAGSGA